MESEGERGRGREGGREGGKEEGREERRKGGREEGGRGRERMDGEGNPSLLSPSLVSFCFTSLSSSLSPLPSFTFP